MKNNAFRKINKLPEYIEELFLSSKTKSAIYCKTAEITAFRGEIGEEVVTVLANGLKETVNTVKKDPVTGNPGWIVTGVGGERYIIEDRKFIEKYEPSPDGVNRYSPKKVPHAAFSVPESISFIAAWGAIMNIEAGGYLVCNRDGEIWGVAKDEFEASYTEDFYCDGLFSYLIQKSDMSEEELKNVYPLYLMMINVKPELIDGLPEATSDAFEKIMTYEIDYLKKTLESAAKKFRETK